MSERNLRVLSIGAHPDDADTSAAGLLTRLHRKGWEVRLLSVTDGSAGAYRQELGGQELKLMRRAEAARSGALLDGRYDVLEHPDGRLEATLPVREELIRYIRRFQPDLILTNRLQDYHADHRSTAQLVQDAAYLLTVPCICPDTPCMQHMPVVLYWHDDFRRPYPFQGEVVVPVDDELESIVRHAACHESQYFDWMYWPDELEKCRWPREKQVARLREQHERRLARLRQEYDATVQSIFGEQAGEIGHVEVYEISEYGEAPSRQFLDILQK